MKDKLGDYRILREISRGGMGVVYLAEQISLKRQVALKVLHAPGTLSRRHLDRFRREAEALARLHHPNIVPVYGIGEDDGVHYFSMKYIEGRTLDAVIEDLRRTADSESRRPGGDVDRALTARLRAPTLHPGTGAATEIASPAPPGKEAAAPRPAAAEARRDRHEPRTDRSYIETVVRIVRDVARALHFAHEQGIVHRDVKPQNVILDESGKPYVMDFGLARDEALGTLTQSGDVFGTPLYMSPEQVSGRRSEIGPRTDVYSLGCTLYELLTLRPAFDGESSEEILRRILLAEPRRPRQLNRRLPPDLENVTLRAMQKSPEKRYATAAEFADDLERFLNYEAVRAAPPSPFESTLRAIRRYRAVSAALAVALVASLAFVYLFFVRSGTLVVNAVFVTSVDGEEVEVVVPSEVRLGGRALGKTPVFASVRPGRYEVRVDPVEERYQAAEVREVEIRSGAPSTLKIQLRRSTGTLVVEKSPPEAVVRIEFPDGRVVSNDEKKSPILVDLPEGKYRIELEARGHVPSGPVVKTIRAQENTTLKVALAEDLLPVAVAASVAVDAVSAGSPLAPKKPPQKAGDPWLLAPGKWTLKTVEDNVVPETLDIEVSKNESDSRTLRASEIRKCGPYNAGDGHPLSDSPALDDLDRDGVLDVIAVSSKGEVVVIQPPRPGADGHRIHRLAKLKTEIAPLSPLVASLPGDGRRFAFAVSSDGRVFAVTIAADGAIPEVGDVVAETLPLPAGEASPLGLVLVSGFDEHLSIAIPFRGGPLVFVEFDGAAFAVRASDDSGPVYAAAPGARDVDGDGTADLLVETDRGVSLHSGFDGSLLVGLEEAPRAAAARPAVLLLDDVTGDGRPEAIVARDRRVSQYSCDGGHPLWTSGDLGVQEIEGLALLPAKAVGLDVAVFSSKSARILSGSDGLEQRDRFRSHPREGRYLGAAILDLDGNGSEDVVIGLDTGVVALTGDRIWVYSPPSTDGPAVATAPVVGDVDGDGALELVVSLRDGNLPVLRGSVPRRVFRFDLPDAARNRRLDSDMTLAPLDDHPGDDIVVVSRPADGGKGDVLFVVDSRDGSYHKFDKFDSETVHPLVVPLFDANDFELLVLTGDPASGMGIEFPGLRKRKPRFESWVWRYGRTFLADFDEDGEADFVRIERSGLQVHSGRDGQPLLLVQPSKLAAPPGGGAGPFRSFPGSLSDPISALFQDVDGDGLFDIVLGFPSSDEDAAEPRRLLALGWPDGRSRDPRILYTVRAPNGLSPRLSRETGAPGAPLLVTWHDGVLPQSPFRGATLLDAATGAVLTDPDTGDELALLPSQLPQEGLFETRLLGVLSRAEAGRTVLLVQTGPAAVEAFALDGPERGRLFSADVAWLAAAGGEIRYVRDPEPIGLVHLAAGNRIAVLDAASGRLDSRHVIPEPVDGLQLRRDASGALEAVYVSGRDLLTAIDVPVPYLPFAWGPFERSARAAEERGDLLETIARVAALRRGREREREEGAALAERVLSRRLGRDERARGERPDPATADLLRVLAHVAR